MTPIIGDLIESTAGKAVGRLLDRFLPKTMTAAERAEVDLASREIVKEEVQAEQKAIEAVNKTIQIESASENWWTSGWRPYWGFISGTAFLVVCVLVSILAYKAVLGGKPEAMAMIPQLIGAFAALFAIPGAILGVTAWHRGKKQRGV